MTQSKACSSTLSSAAPVEFNVPNTALGRSASHLLAQAGIEVNGPRPWDMQLHAPGVVERVFSQGSLGLGEAYMEGMWSARHLDQFFYRILRSGLDEEIRSTRFLLHALLTRFTNRQGKRQSRHAIAAHYDLGNDFYAAMLDSRMTYTCGYWHDATTLDAAQEAKLDLICRKLQLQPGMRLLDIGCGWGSLMAYAAEHYQVECVGATLSRSQAEWATERYADTRMRFLLQDYRDLTGQFDAIASVGMFEHVGRKNYRTFFEVAHRLLAPDGLFLLHTIGKNSHRGGSDPWMDRYIFPGGDLPSAAQISCAADGLFIIEDLHSFGADYDRTLMAWCANFDRAWDRFADRYDPHFYRMWKYYLLSCAGAFRARSIQLWQWVLSKNGLDGGYRIENVL